MIGVRIGALSDSGKLRSLAASALLLCAIAVAGGPAAHAQDEEGEGRIEFEAEIERGRVSQDESVLLRLTVKTSSGFGEIGAPTFDAPDFEELNDYQEQQNNFGVVNGRISFSHTMRITKVLRPLKPGTLKIRRIELKARGKTYKAPDLTVVVDPPGAGAAPPRGYGGGGVGLRGSGKNNGVVRNVMLRAELGKARAFKGEQVILNYYLYTRVQLFNMAASKFPVLNGFLKEELDLPIQKRLDFDLVVVDGVEYRRALLASYALYPLQEGKLKIDPFGIKYDYLPGGSVDSLGMGMLFGRQPVRSGKEQSELMTLEVAPLPAGKPASFSGAVGDFTLDSAVDKYEVRANEAVTLTVKIEGAGNVAAIGEPKISWPANIEIYDTKGRAKAGRGGVGEKIFEYVLIPRAPGKLTLPGVELSFFAPGSQKYEVKTTAPIEVTVLDAAPGSEAPKPRAEGDGAPAQSGAPQAGAPAARKDVLKPLLPPERDSGSSSAIPLWRMLYWAASLALALFVAFVLFDTLMRTGKARFPRKAAPDQAKKLARARAAAQKATAGLAWNEVAGAYDGLAGALFDALDETYGVGARSYSREALEQMLVSERGMPEAQWKRVKQLLEFAELVKYASATGVVSEAQAREKLGHWVSEAEELRQALQTAPAREA